MVVSNDEPDRDTKFYQVQDSPVDGVQPGEVIELHPSAASAFVDNLSEIDADTREDAEEEAENYTVPGQRSGSGPGMSPLDIDAGTFVVQDDPIGGVQPGETIDLSPEVARAFSDNLEAADADADSDSDSDDGSDTAGESNAAAEADGDADAGDENDGHRFYSDADQFNAQAFVERTPQRDIRSDLDSGEYDAHLDAILEAEEAHKGRQGVHEAVEERRSASE